MDETARTTIDEAEIAHFSRLAEEWWDPHGKFRVLHNFNPVRLAYIKEKICQVLDRDPLREKPLENLRILDIGCGGGLLCEPLARLGGDVVGADASPVNIEIAKTRNRDNGPAIDYRATTAEALAGAGEKFDVVLAMEVVEHVADRGLFMSSAASMLKPGGLMFVATINRTRKAWLLAIIGAEYILGWIPKGTHSYGKLVRPEELMQAFSVSGLTFIDEAGVTYHPLDNSWRRSRDMSVNYMMLARRPV